MPAVSVNGVRIEIQGINDVLEPELQQQPHFARRVHGHYTDDRRNIHSDTIVSITEETWFKIYRTLRILPAQHLQLVSTIIFCDRPYISGGNSGRQSIIEINYRVLDPHIRRVNYDQRNNPHLYLATLLHEFGHKVNTEFESLDYLRANHPPMFRYLTRIAIDEARQTQGPDERYADAYMDYHRLGPEEMRHRDSRRFNAFMSCPPFRT